MNGRVQGLLWFDSAGTLEQRLRRAIIHYEAKYKLRVRCALVNNSEWVESGGLCNIDGVQVVPSIAMLPQHYLIGEVCDDSGE